MKVYATQLKNKRLLLQSSSGGMFTAISDYVLDNNGVVACAIYNYNQNTMEYEIISDKARRDTARGSKYIQSNPVDIFVECEKFLKKYPSKKLMFVGTGCYVAGFKRFGEKRGILDRVILVDIICHGVPSPKIWKDYVTTLGKKQEITFVSFKDKRRGWNLPIAYVVSHGREKYIKPYVNMYYSECMTRPSCYKCPYSHIDRVGDISIGDFWGIEKQRTRLDINNGVSLCLVNSIKGEHIFEEIKFALDYQESNIEDCLQPNLMAPTKQPKDRERFWTVYHQEGIKRLLREYGRYTKVDYMKAEVKRIIKIVINALKNSGGGGMTP